jgi:hypothetical protein
MPYGLDATDVLIFLVELAEQGGVLLVDGVLFLLDFVDDIVQLILEILRLLQLDLNIASALGVLDLPLEERDLGVEIFFLGFRDVLRHLAVLQLPQPIQEVLPAPFEGILVLLQLFILASRESTLALAFWIAWWRSSPNLLRSTLSSASLSLSCCTSLN